MKRILLLLLLPIVLVSGAVCQQRSGISATLVRYTVSVDGFSVNLHSRPTMTTTKVSRKDGTERTKRSLTTTVKSVAYSIEIFENLKPGQPLDEFIAESKASFQYDPATERNLTVDGFPGKEYSSQTETTTTVMQFFATEDRLFRFAVTGPAAAAASIKEFFSSIKLGPNTDGFDVSSEVFVELYNGERVYLGRDVDVKARLVTKPEPTYTEDARDKKVEGTVILRAILAKTGRVERIRVVQGLPYGLTVQAIEAARKIEFVPAMKDGKAVSMWLQLEYNFLL
jgi:TonB family protein